MMTSHGPEISKIRISASNLVGNHLWWASNVKFHYSLGILSLGILKLICRFIFIPNKISEQKFSGLLFTPCIRDAQTRMFVLVPSSRILCTEYEKYGVQRGSCPKSTDWSTGYGNFCQNGVRLIISSTGSTVL